MFKSSWIRTINRRPRLLHLQCIWSAGDVKEPTHLSQRVGHGVPGVVVWPIHMYPWVGWMDEVIYMDG